MGSNTRSSMFLNLAFLLAFFLAVSVTESNRLGIGFGKPPAAAAPTCDSVYGVQAADTCFGVAQNFSLSNEVFAALNPNLNCSQLFVGQWLCVAGTA